ncbi:MAG: lantibiotic immunity ABC transporter MutG family permease subunit [Lachnospiraceae bacterium]
MSFGSNIKSDLYKIFHTPIWFIHLMIPIIGIMLFLWYYSISPWDELSKLSGYIQILSVAFPLLIAIITSILSEIEQKAGAFYSVLTTVNKKSIPHISKIVLLVALGGMSALFALLGFGIGFTELGYHTFPIIFYIKTAALLLISVIPLYLLHYAISFIFGKGFNIGLGIVGSLVSALLLTGLGDGMWFCIPWGIAGRFSENLLRSKLLNTTFFQQTDVVKSIIFLFLFSVFFTVAIVLLFNKWEGRKSDD